MDYDDNDFHSQNLHLDGEGNPKYPSVLQPYALPKFDFDDSIQGHLRFDSLVETEVFLGIENNESNHWIGDFTRGSTGIEFSSSAAGVCSISRRNNVWSEATSSESVQMLLKSVGQEEVITSGTIIENLDACDELCCLIKQMEPRLKNDDIILSKVQDVRDLQSKLLPLDEVPRDFSADHHVEESIQTHPGDLHADGSSSGLQASTISENCGLSISGGTTFGDRKLDDEYRREDGTSAIEHPVDKLQDSFASGMQVETLVTSVHGLVMRSSELNYDGVQHQVNDVYEESPDFHVSREEPEMNKRNVDTSQDEKHHCLTSKAETTVEVSAIETSIINVEEPSSNMSKDHPDQHRVECSTEGFSRVSVEIHKFEDVILDKGSNFGSDQPYKVSEQELSPVTFGGDSLPSKNGLKMVADPKEDQMTSSTSLGSSQLDRTEKAATKDASLSSPIESSQSVSGQRPFFSVAEAGVSYNSVGNLLCEPIDQSFPMSSYCCAETQKGSQETETIEVKDQETKEIGECPVSSESTEKHGDVKEATGFTQSLNGVTGGKSIGTKFVDASEIKTKNDTTYTQPGSLLPEETHCTAAQKIEEGNTATLDSKEENSWQTIEQNDNKMTKNDITHTQPGPLLLEETCCTAAPIIEEGNKAPLDSKDEVSGQNIERNDNGNAPEIRVGSFDSVSLPESHTKSSSHEDLFGSADCNEPVCGSSEFVEGTHGKVDTKVHKNQKAPVVDVASHVSSNTHEPKGNDASINKRSGSVDVSLTMELPKGDSGINGKSLSAVSAPKRSSDSSLGRSELKTRTHDISQASPLASDGKTVRDCAKGTPETKRRRSSAKSAGKDKKGTQHVKSNELQHYGHVKGSNAKPYLVAASLTSGLPNSNTSGSQSALFQQSFTDFQQVQLRAQIFVYGALIQGIAPEEAYMVSALDGPDGGRSMWENVWRTCIERLRGQKSSAVDPETPLHPQSVSKASDQVTKQNSLQSKDTAGHASTKGTQTIISPLIPLSSPLWSVSTPVGDTLKSSVMPRGSVSNYQQSLSPLYPFQTPPMRSFVGHNASWMPQASLRGPWVAPPQSSVPEASIRISLFPSTEVVQLNPVKETSTPNPSATKLVFSGPIVHAGDQRSGLAGVPSALDSKTILSSSGRPSTDYKPRKRKKSLVSEERDQIVLQPLSQPEPVVTSSLPLSISITTLAPTPFVSKSMSEKLILPASPAYSYDHLKRVGHDSVYRSNLPEETLDKFMETRKQAEDANALAATAVGHCQEIWNQLDKNQNSGLSSDVEAKLASAAVQVAAAAAVAKAASAAANVASSAALQVKLMADEAMVSIIGGISSGRPGTFSDEVSGNATPASISRSDDGANSSSSIITAAREAAWKRVEDASAASKRAENMDAIVKAAELASEAVSQAVKIVAMGDPLPLSKLVEAGPQGYWKIPQVSSGPVKKSTDMIRDQPKGAAGEVVDISTKNSKGRQSSRKEAHMIVSEKSQSVVNVGKEPIDDQLRLVDVPSGSLVGERQSGQIGHKYSDLSKNISVVLESGIGSELSPIVVESKLEKAAKTSKGNSIKEGSQVEVFKDGDGCKAAWFTAKVLTVKNGKAFVSYPEIYLDQGLGGQVKEWVELESGVDAPKIRLARPITTVQFEGTRKRRRAVMGDHTWSIGDRVDAWITYSWWEGVITEKYKKDETSLTVHFPAQGVTSVVKAWHLRPSLTWKGGHWIEFSNLRNDSSLEGDMPQEKRPKLGSPAVEAKGKDRISKNIDNGCLGKLEETRLLDLSSNERVFNIGKNTRTTNKPDETRTIRTGLQEGSRVKFGVPKPGKKRKFMEVSKHFVSDQTTKTNEAIDSAKPCLIPHRQGLHGLKNTVKIDSKKKQVADSKLKRIKSRKQQGISGRSIPLKDNSPANEISAIGAGIVKDRTRAKDSTSQLIGTTSGKNDPTETRSFSTTEGTAENPILFSSSAPASDAPSKRVSSGKTDQTKRKLAPARGKLGKIEEDGVSNGAPVKSTSGFVEPRRSIRRIQPTSRLLEGLQSSLIMSKIPFSHDRGHRSQNRNISKRE